MDTRGIYPTWSWSSCRTIVARLRLIVDSNVTKVNYAQGDLPGTGGVFSSRQAIA